MTTHSSLPASIQTMKITLAGVNGKVSHVESDTIPELQEQLEHVLDHLARLTGSLEDQKRSNVSMDDFFSVRTQVARNETDNVGL